MPEGFHHEHKPKGIAIATDIDDGRPGAYDLPSPTTAGALAPTAEPKDKSGKPLTNGVSGNMAQDEEERWIERTGFAPRFGNPFAEEDGETIFDHQTWIEGKLEDKFFGGQFYAKPSSKKISNI